MRKLVTMVGFVSLLSLGFTACDSDSDDDRKSNGADCVNADECLSEYCGADNKCADKPAADSKKDNGADCANGDECKSAYCGDNKKCADKPAADSKNDNGADCANGDECKSTYCGADNKCADKPAEKSVEDMTTDYCKAINNDTATQASCINDTQNLIQKAADCKDKLEASVKCNYENKDKSASERDTACKSASDDKNLCLATKYLDLYYGIKANEFCVREYEKHINDDNPDNDEPISDCIAEVNSIISEQTDDCKDAMRSFYICEWDHESDSEVACASLLNSLETCIGSSDNEESQDEE